jgi:hypothetical protein
VDVGQSGHRIEQVEDSRILLVSKKTWSRRRAVWRWTVEWSGRGRRTSAIWLPTRALAEEAGLTAWAGWGRERERGREQSLP